jgi:phage-related baseplate assembly protein
LAALVALVLVAALSSCSGDSGDGGAEEKVIDSIAVTIKDGKVTPSGTRIQIAKDEPLTFRVDSDVAGEIHIHSKPEQSVVFEAGQTEHDVTFDKPGIFPAELHEPAQVVVELEVR